MYNFVLSSQKWTIKSGIQTYLSTYVCVYLSIYLLIDYLSIYLSIYHSYHHHIVIRFKGVILIGWIDTGYLIAKHGNEMLPFHYLLLFHICTEIQASHS